MKKLWHFFKNVFEIFEIEIRNFKIGKFSISKIFKKQIPKFQNFKISKIHDTRTGPPPLRRHPPPSVDRSTQRRFRVPQSDGIAGWVRFKGLFRSSKIQERKKNIKFPPTKSSRIFLKIFLTFLQNVLTFFEIDFFSFFESEKIRILKFWISFSKFSKTFWGKCQQFFIFR